MLQDGLDTVTIPADQGFVFGPPADVPQRLSSNRVCSTVAPPPVSTGPAPTSSPADLAGPAETDLALAGAPATRPGRPR